MMPAMREMLLGWAFMILIAVAGRFPLHIGPKTKVVVDTSLIFAATLLFPKPWGVAIVALGVLAGHILFWRVWLDALVNVGIVTVEVLIVQSVFLALRGTIPITFGSPLILVSLVGSGCAALAVERLLLSAAIALYQGQGLVRTFLGSWSEELRSDAALLLMGVLTALVVEVEPWALLLTILPVALVYVSLRNALRLRLLTRGAVESLADLIDKRDPYTAGHSARVSKLAERLATEMGLAPEEIENVRAAARVHDLGKIGVDAIMLNKPGRLNEAEWRALRTHPEAGGEIISRFPEFAAGAAYVRHHHERWDGKGYPCGLKGKEIPTGAQIIAVADAFDAMTSDRPYRKALEVSTVLTELRHGAGAQWNEQVVSALLRVLDKQYLEADKAVPVATQA